MPQSIDSLPPPAVEWRRESDEERKQRLERAGVLDPQPAATSSSTRTEKSFFPVERLKEQLEENKKQAKKTYVLWWIADAARWRSLRSPRDTTTLADGSWSVGMDITHPQWTVGDSKFMFGPKAFFYNGAQYAKLVDPIFSGNGFANFVSSELGLSASFLNMSEDQGDSLRWFWSAGTVYTPVRWVKAERTSSAPTIARSDTYSKTGISLPGLGVQCGIGADWNSLFKIEAFAGVHAAWPVQVRLRTGLQLSMGMTVDALPFQPQ